MKRSIPIATLNSNVKGVSSQSDLGASKAARSSSSRRKQPERDLHKAVARLLDHSLPNDAFWYPVPNGGVRSALNAWRLKISGEVRPGIPDLCIVYRGKAIFCELKAKRGYLSPEQKWVHQRLMLSGAVVFVARSVQEVQDQLECMMPLKARLT